MIGKKDQVKQAEQVKARIDAEFDRIAQALTSAATRQTGQDRIDTEAVIIIVQNRRAEVMAKSQASYFINNWREVRDEVRALIAQDPAYRAINTQRARRQR